MRLSEAVSLLSVAALLAGCAPQKPAATGQDSVAAPATPPRLPDSLALRTAEGVEVWLTDARSATAADGTSCLERALEVRQDTLARGVPLLYTREAPTALGKDAMRAVLYNNCAPVAAYRVDFATISPKRLSP